MQVAYEVRESPIAGRGIFVTEPVRRGALIWRCSEESVKEHDEASLRARLAGMAPEEAKLKLEYIYCWEGMAVEILDDAYLWNHAASPNTGNHPDGDGDGVSSYALRDIEAGEELTDDYATFVDLPWFEKLCLEYGASSCIEVGRAHRE